MSKHVSKPLVSIILRTYNRADCLLRAIKSVIAQTYQAWELIIVDDGSTDDSEKIITPYLSDQRISLIRQKNQGQALAFNSGLKKSSGKYVTLIDSDDAYMRRHIQLRVTFMQKNKSIDLIHSNAKIIGSSYVPDKYDFTKKIHLDDCPLGSTFFAKKNVFTTLRGFKNISYSEDSDFLERAKKKFSVVKINAPTYIYHRDTPDSICNNAAIKLGKAAK